MSGYTQEHRPFRVETALGAEAFQLLGFSGEEGLSLPFRYTLDMASTDPAVDAARLLGSGVTLSIELPGGEERVTHGVIRRFHQRGRLSDDRTAYRAEIVPWLWLLSLSSDCRIYQNLDVLQILQAVFGELGYTDFRVDCSKSYAPREYCVQYRESHLDFVSRLLEEEGIFYFFAHSPGRHVLTLTDQNRALPDCPGPQPVRMAPAHGAHIDEDVVTHLKREYEVHTTAVTLRDYDYLVPSQRLEGSASGEPAGAVSAEHYDYPGKFGTRTEGERLARIRLEERAARASQIRGRSDCRAFQGGAHFELSDHPDAAANRRYYLTRLRQTARVSEYRADTGRPASYRNQFIGVPDDVPFRPRQRTLKPVVPGSQTALVVGPSGDEVHVDRYGRVKVQFRWDRKGRNDENSSCWVRVSSAWAGKGWGAIHLPRVGQEVVVDFLEGDPDRPIITGRVYNGDQMPPYPLPREKARSGVRSRSTRGGGTENFNELRFDDTLGSEEIFLQAEKDLTIVIEHDRSGSVKNDDGLEVGRNLSLVVGENVRNRVGKDRTVSVTGDDRLSIGKGRTESVGQALDVSARTKVTISAGTELKLVGPGGSITIGPTGIKIESAGLVQVKGSLVKIN
jgi:type VI secretion system secreted protein VgrG